MKKEELQNGMSIKMVIGEGNNSEHHEATIIEIGDFISRIKITTIGFNMPEISMPTNLIIKRINLAIKNTTTLVIPS